MAEQFSGAEQRHLDRTPVSNAVFKRFGITTTIVTQTVTIGTTVGAVIRNNPNRISLIIINNSDSTVNIDFTKDLSTTRGIVLSASGGSFDMNLNDEGEAVTNAIYGVSGSASRTLTVIETVVGGG